MCLTLYATNAVPMLQESTGPYSEPEESNQHHPQLVWFKTIPTLSSHLHLSLPSGIFHSDFLSKILHALSSLQYPIHLILQYLIRCTNYKASHYAVFFSLLLFLFWPNKATQFLSCYVFIHKTTAHTIHVRPRNRFLPQSNVKTTSCTLQPWISQFEI